MAVRRREGLSYRFGGSLLRCAMVFPFSVVPHNLDILLVLIAPRKADSHARRDYAYAERRIGTNRISTR